jgi:hypothetical protein
MKILLTNQTTANQNGIYTVKRTTTAGTFRLDNKTTPNNDGDDVLAKLGATTYTYTSPNTYAAAVDDRHGPFPIPRGGNISQLEQQLLPSRLPRFARIYGFSYESTYYDLPTPALFLVHGDGAEASEFHVSPSATAQRNPSRAPANPSLTGVNAADFEFADDVRVWSYDKADYTIRMDVLTGMFEQVLLDNFFDDVGTSTRLAGAKVSGAKVSGAKVSGAKVSGAKLSGRWDPSD